MHVESHRDTFHLGIQLQLVRIVELGRVGYERVRRPDANVLYFGVVQFFADCFAAHYVDFVAEVKRVQVAAENPRSAYYVALVQLLYAYTLD